MFPWHPLADPGIFCTRMNILRVGYTGLDTDLPLCYLCMTGVHEAK